MVAIQHKLLIGVLLWGASSASADIPPRPAYSKAVEQIISSSPPPKGHSLATALVFLKTSCHLAQKYQGRLNELVDKYPDVRFIGVFSGAQADPKTVRAFSDRYRSKVEMLPDPKNQLANLLRAEVTPEAFLFDSNFVLSYRGPIDDQFGLDGELLKASQNYLEDSVRALVEQTALPHTVVTASGCPIERSSEERQAVTPTFSRDIAPVIQTKCLSCHSPGQIQEGLPLTSYEEVNGSKDAIAFQVETRRMPPWDADSRFGTFEGDLHLDVNEIWAFRKWARLNGPKDKGHFELKPPPTTDSPWTLGTPSAVFRNVPLNEPYRIPASGLVPYRYFRIKTNFEEPKYLVASEVKPSNRRALHHVNLFLRKEDSAREALIRNPLAKALIRKRLRPRTPQEEEAAFDRDESEMSYLLYGPKMTTPISIVGMFSPTQTVLRFPKNTGVWIPAGGELIFEQHYQTNGSTEAEDVTSVALYFSDEPPEAASEIITRTGAPHRSEIKIPPQETLSLTRTYQFTKPVILYGFQPHMHRRGKSFRAEIETPDGRRETVLFVPRYRYQWQMAYPFTRPRLLPAGTKVLQTYSWDNTPERMGKDESSRAVSFGLQLQDEMGLDYIQYSYANPDDEEPGEAELTDSLNTTASQITLPTP